MILLKNFISFDSVFSGNPVVIMRFNFIQVIWKHKNIKVIQLHINDYGKNVFCKKKLNFHI